MGKESVKDGVWYPAFIMKDLIDVGGLSAKSLGYDVTDLQGKRFFYDRNPFALVAWKMDGYAMLAFPKAFPEEFMTLIIKAFIVVLGYKPFVQYEIFQQRQNEFFLVFEWEKLNPKAKMQEIIGTAGVKNVLDISEQY